MRSKKTQFTAMLALATAGSFALTSCSSSSTFEFQDTSFGPAKNITVTFPQEVIEGLEHAITIPSFTMTGKGETSSLCRVDFEFEYYDGASEALSTPELTKEVAASQRGGSIIRFYEALLKEANKDLKEIDASPDEYSTLRTAIEETQNLYKNGEYLDEWDALVRPAFPDIETAFLKANNAKSFADYVKNAPDAAYLIVSAYTYDETSESANFDVDPSLLMDLSGGMTSYMEQVVERITAGWESAAEEATAIPKETNIAKRIGFPKGLPLTEFDEDAPVEGSYFSEDLTQAVVIMGCSDFGEDKKPRLYGYAHELKIKLLKEDNSIMWDSTQLEFMTDPEGKIAIVNAEIGSTLEYVVEGWPDEALLD